MNVSIKSENWFNSASDAVDGHFDLVVAAAGWDRRCLSILESRNLISAYGLMISYRDKGTSGRSELNESTLVKGLSKVCSEPLIEIEVDSNDALAAWRVVRQKVIEVYNQLGRPLKVLIEISTLPRYISMSALGFGAKTGIFSQVTVFYVAASEYEVSEFSDDLIFSAGEWRPLPVIGLGSPGISRGAMHLLVSVGFDGPKIGRLVSSLEPDRLSLMFAEPGTSAENEMIARDKNRKLISDYRVPESQIFSAPASSIQKTIEVMSHILEEPYVRKDGRSESHSILVCGLKAHAVAIALYSLDHSVKNVYYAQPKSHREVDSKSPSGVLAIELDFPW